ncbi:MAG TPA: adenylate/guanylate cyclase domain-containing protein [Candidatus Limnocylindrales bacterium]|nr:adenylate/guanylate cyclase domain-containing protein [Candidatus Limnocylindrales bacterium]
MADSSEQTSFQAGQRAARRLRRIGLMLSAAVVLAGISAIVSDPAIDLVMSIRNAVFDGYQRSMPRKYEPAPVRILDIDEESLARLGQWPWPRTRIAEIVARLRELGAASITFDILFAEPDRMSPRQLVSEWAERDDVRAVLEHLPDSDEVLAAELARGNVVTAFALTEGGGPERPPLEKARFVRIGSEGKLLLSHHQGAVATLPNLEAAASGNGAINFQPDRDGVVRRVPLLLEMGGKTYPSLLVEALRVAVGQGNVTVLTAPGRSESTAQLTGLRIAEHVLPTDSTGRMQVYLTRPMPERYVPAWKVLSGQAEGLIPKGAIVFLGSSATALMDLRFSPLGTALPGVEIHAQLVEQILHKVHSSRPDWARGSEVLLVVLSWLGMLAVGNQPRVLPLALVTALGVALAFSVSWQSWNLSLLLVDPITPSVTVLAAFLAYVVPRQLATESEERWIRSVFANYLSPNLVEHLIRNPSELRVGGERRECSFVLTDVAGFTSVVENMDPAELTGVINDYLDGMVRIAFSHDATLDRIVGDAVAVLFSAPVTQADHAQRAVACALDMDAFASDYARRCKENGIDFGHTRIGVHTGEVVVGNFGGSQHFDYRPLGDPINTAARLETANRQLGTRICISAATVAACTGNGVPLRPVGSLLLKGKTRGVDVFEPVRTDANGVAPFDAYKHAFDMLEKDGDGALQAFRKLAEQHPEDGLVSFHLRRLERGERGTLIVFTEK